MYYNTTRKLHAFGFHNAVLRCEREKILTASQIHMVDERKEERSAWGDQGSLPYSVNMTDLLQINGGNHIPLNCPESQGFSDRQTEIKGC